MDTMGSTCSVNRQNKNVDTQNNESDDEFESHTPGVCRHSIDVEVPDESIAALYPVEDNYVMDDDNINRSPKTLAQLCTDSVCRHLVDFEQEIPDGLPQELVNGILQSLVKHSALNASTLKALRRQQIVELPLQGSRGVSDEWLGALNEDGQKVNVLDNDSDTDESTSKSPSCRWDMEPLQPSDRSAILDISMSTETPLSHNARNPSMFAQATLLDLRDSQKLTDKGLMYLTKLDRVETVRLDNCYSITGRGLLSLSKSHRIHTLTMSNCRCLTDEAIVNIRHLTRLLTLSLDGCRCLTDISLRSIGRMVSLRKLDLSQCDLLSDEGLSNLSNLLFIEELSLGWCRRISDNGIKILAQQPGRSDHLRTLNLARCNITDSGVEYLSNFQALRNLVLNGCDKIKSASLGNALSSLQNLETLDVSYCHNILNASWQGKINSLRSLDLCYAAVTDTHLSRFTSLQSLEEINFDSCPVGDWSISHLAGNNVVPNLVSLNLADCDLSDFGMVHIPKFKLLKHLSLFYCNISNHGLRHLSTMINLETLNLDSRDISDDGMYHLRNLKLKSLDIFSARITDIGCIHLKRIKSLESLEICGGNVGDLGCAQLASSLKNLTSLNLGHNELITNLGASSLTALANLKALNLSYTRVNAGALGHLRSLQQLQSLAMYGCEGVPDSDRNNTLQYDLPNLKCLRVNGCPKGEGTIGSPSGSSELSFDNTGENDMSSGEESEGENFLIYSNEEINADSDDESDYHDSQGVDLF